MIWLIIGGIPYIIPAVVYIYIPYKVLSQTYTFVRDVYDTARVCKEKTTNAIDTIKYVSNFGQQDDHIDHIDHIDHNKEKDND